MNRFLPAMQLAASAGVGAGGFTRINFSSLGHTSGADLYIGSNIDIFLNQDAVIGKLIGSGRGKITFDPSKPITLRLNEAMQEAGAVYGDPGFIWRIRSADGTGPHPHRVRIILDGPEESRTPRPDHPDVPGTPQGYTNTGHSRVISNHGTRDWEGMTRQKNVTKLAAHALAGDTSAVLEGDCSDWALDDPIIIMPDNFAGQANYEERLITTVDAYDSGSDTTTVHWTTPLTEDHFGVLQYPIDAPYGTNAMSLTPGTFTPPDADTPTIYDVRCEVMNLYCGITVEGPYDSAHVDNGFGPTLMNHIGAYCYSKGVAVIDGGQQGNLGRYPDHDHSLSYADRTSVVTFDTSGPLIRVNWPAHGIEPVEVIVGTVTFTQNPFIGAGSGSLVANLSGIAQASGGGRYVTFQPGPGTLPSNLTAGQVYWLSDTGGDTYIVCTEYTGNINASGAPPRVAWVDNGSGTSAVDASVSDQPIAFTTTGTLPSSMAIGTLNRSIAQFVGTRYEVAGASITPDTFCLTQPSAAGAGSGVHTAKYTYWVEDRPDIKRIKSVVRHSKNGGFVNHATCGTETTDCITFDTRGVGFLDEDNSEMRAKKHRNRAVLARNPILQSDRLRDFEGTFNGSGTTFAFQTSGFWFAHPFNDYQDNIGYLCDGQGAHNSYGAQGFGLSSLVNVKPYLGDVLRWKGNGGFCNYGRGAMTQFGVTDQFGRSDGNSNTGQWNPQHNDLGANGFERNLLEGGICIKNRQGGYFNSPQGVGSFEKSWIVGDNNGGGIEGSTRLSLTPFRSFLFVNDSFLPPATAPLPLPEVLADYSLPVPTFGGATYHWTQIVKGNAFQNYRWGRPYYKRAGQQDTGTDGSISYRDQYTDGTATRRRFAAIGSKFNNSHPGHLTRAPHLAGYPVTLTLANPCVVTVGFADVASGTREFTVCEDEPIILTRVSRGTGTFPAPFYKYMRGYAKNVKTIGGSLVGRAKTGVVFELALTPGGASISTAGSSQVGTLCMMPMWRSGQDGAGTPRAEPLIHGMGTCMPDPECDFGQGSTGATPRWVCPYGDDPFFAHDAADAFDCEPTTADGVFGLGFSTTDSFIGANNLHNDVIGNDPNEAHSGLRVVRYDPADMSVIGPYNLEPLRAGEAAFFQNFQHAALKNRGRYSIKAAADYAAPTMLSGVRLTLANESGLDFMIGLEFSGAATPNKVFRTIAESASAPADRDTGTGMSIACTAVASLALAAASSDGSKFWHDTANDLVWVRWVPLAGNSAYETYLASLPDSEPVKGDRSSWYVVQHV